MKFLLDVCASSQSLRTLLADLGHDVRLAVDVDPRASDETLLDLAFQEKRVLVTEDKDFMVLRRLAGKTENSAPVLTLITQFGGGKTHTLALLYHLVGQAAGPSSQAGSLRHKIAAWTKQRGKSPRLYPGSLVWCVRKPGRDLKEKIEVWLAWKRVEKEINDGTLGGDFDRADRTEITTNLLAPGASLISLLLPFSWVHPAVAGYCSNTERS